MYCAATVWLGHRAEPPGIRAPVISKVCGHLENYPCPTCYRDEEPRPGLPGPDWTFHIRACIGGWRILNRLLEFKNGNSRRVSQICGRSTTHPRIDFLARGPRRQRVFSGFRSWVRFPIELGGVQCWALSVCWRC